MSETEANKDRHTWYRSERADWFAKLTTVLSKLEDQVSDLVTDNDTADSEDETKSTGVA